MPNGQRRYGLRGGWGWIVFIIIILIIIGWGWGGRWGGWGGGGWWGANNSVSNHAATSPPHTGATGGAGPANRTAAH